MDVNFWIDTLEGNGRFINEVEQKIRGLPNGAVIKQGGNTYLDDKYIGKTDKKKGIFTKATEKETESHDNSKKHLKNVDTEFKKKSDETNDDYEKRKSQEVVTRTLADKLGREKAEKLMTAVKKFQDNEDKDPTILKSLADVMKKNLGAVALGSLSIFDKDLGDAVGGTVDAAKSGIDFVKDKSIKDKQKEIDSAKEKISKSKQLTKEEIEKKLEKLESENEKIESDIDKIKEGIDDLEVTMKDLEDAGEMENKSKIEDIKNNIELETKDLTNLQYKKEENDIKIKKLEDQLEKYDDKLESYDPIKNEEKSMNWKNYLIEKTSTEEAKGALDAIVNSLSKNKELDKEGKEILDMAKGMVDYYKKEKSFSPSQAQWIYKVSKGMFK
jgi:hypothetical protein